MVGHDGVGDVLQGYGRQRRQFRRLPDHRIATDGGQGGVPRPDGDGKVEGGDDADGAEWMPLLVHAVPGPFGVHRQAVELARQSGGEFADVDHLLHFADTFGANLAHLQGD